MTKYRLEIWNPVTKHYEITGEYNTLIRATIMYNKSYHSKHTRRMIAIEEKLLWQDKGKK